MRGARGGAARRGARSDDLSARFESSLLQTEHTESIREFCATIEVVPIGDRATGLRDRRDRAEAAGRRSGKAAGLVGRRGMTSYRQRPVRSRTGVAG